MLKIQQQILAIVLMCGIGAFTVFAAPPGSEYRPAETLDPTCSPGDANCSVSPLNLGQAIGANASGTSPTSGGLFFASASSTFTQNASLLWNTLTDHLNLAGAGLDMTVASSSLSAAASPTLGTSPRDIYVDGGIAYITDITDDTLRIVDVSDPTNPSTISTTALTGFGAPTELWAVGQYVYASGGDNNEFYIIDVSDKTSPVVVGSVGVGPNPFGLAIDGGYAYVIDDGSNDIKIISLAEPSNPTVVGSVTVSANPAGVGVRGNYAFVSDYSTGEISAVDIADRTNPVDLGSVDAGSFTLFPVVQGNYVYTVDRSSDTLVSIDASDPSDLSIADTLTVGDQPWEVFVAGNYAYVVHEGSDDFYVVDISDPTDMSTVGTFSLGGSTVNGFRVHIVGNYAYVLGNGAAGGLTIINLSGLTTHAAEIGSLETGSLNVNDGAHFAKQVYIDSGLNVGSGILTNGNLSVAPESGSTTAMSIYTAPGSQGDILNLFASTTEVMTVTSSGYLGLGTTAPSTTIHMTGAHTLIETSTTPTNPTQSAEARMYVKDDKFIIQFNDAGTVRYKYLEMVGTNTTWVATTTAP